MISSIMMIGAPSLVFACPHLEWGTPKQSDLVICREGYALGYNYQLKAADWVAFKLEAQAAGAGVERKDQFAPDPDIPEEYQTTPEDYLEPIYQQGHLASSESIDTTASASRETFYMSNLVPQLPTHNKGIWKGLENRERKYANHRGVVYVYAGGLYQGELDYIGNQVPVPSHLWKVIFDPSTQKALTYIIDHEPLYTRDLDKYLESVDELELKAGIDLLDVLPPAQQSVIEAHPEPKQWVK